MSFFIKKIEETLFDYNFVLTQQREGVPIVPSFPLPFFLPYPSFLAGNTPPSLILPLDFPNAQPQRRTEFRGPGALA